MWEVAVELSLSYSSRLQIVRRIKRRNVMVPISKHKRDVHSCGNSR